VVVSFPATRAAFAGRTQPHFVAEELGAGLARWSTRRWFIGQDGVGIAVDDAFALPDLSVTIGPSTM
jgi:hypothetical protein